MHMSDTCFVKNPYRIESAKAKYGVKNGLILVGEQPLAVRVTGGGNYVTRQVMPEYKELLRAGYTNVINMLEQDSLRHVTRTISGTIYK